MKLRHLIIGISICSGLFSLHAQKRGGKAALDMSCFSILGTASDYYNKGKFEECVASLEGALAKCPYSKEEKEIVLELLAKAYLGMDNTVKADSTFLQLFKNNPYYKVKETEDNEEFIYENQKIKSHSLVSIGVRNAASVMRYSAIKTHSVLDGLDYTAPYSRGGIAFLYYGWLEYEFIKNISFNADLIFMWSSYARVFDKEPGFYLQYSEKNNYMVLPFYFRKYFPVGEHVLPYVLMGGNWKYMYKARANAYISYTQDNLITGNNIDYYENLEDLNVLPMRNKNIFDWVAGAGIGYQIRELRMYLDVRYYGGINSLNNPSKRYDIPVLQERFFYIDDVLRLNNFEFGASISYTLFNSIKKKE